MRNEGRRSVTVVSRSGEVVFDRARYRCRVCKAYQTPADALVCCGSQRVTWLEQLVIDQHEVHLACEPMWELVQHVGGKRAANGSCPARLPIECSRHPTQKPVGCEQLLHPTKARLPRSAFPEETPVILPPLSREGHPIVAHRFNDGEAVPTTHRVQLYFSRRALRHFVGRTSSSVRVETLAERRTRTSVVRLNPSRVKSRNGRSLRNPWSRGSRSEAPVRITVAPVRAADRERIVASPLKRWAVSGCPLAGHRGTSDGLSFCGECVIWLCFTSGKPSGGGPNPDVGCRLHSFRSLGRLRSRLGRELWPIAYGVFLPRDSR